MENSPKYYFLNASVNISIFGPLNINVNTALKYYRNQALKKKLKLMREAM